MNQHRASPHSDGSASSASPRSNGNAASNASPENTAEATPREGNLQAPSRHALAWREAGFYDEQACLTEVGRIFNICHGCRRCVNLCNAFPTLFDLIDQNASMELEGVARQDYWKVVEQCYLCDVCFMTKCPYVPPHPWNVDFPHTMLRAKAVRFKAGQHKARDRLLSATDTIGRLAANPLVATVVNTVNRMPLARRAMQRLLGVHARRELPPYSSARLRRTAKASAPHPERDGERTRGKVALFATCYLNYNEPGIGHDLLAVLDHNRIPYVLLEEEVCCGMPKLELGDLEAVARLAERNLPRLAALARAGYALLSAVPSCTLMFKRELPLLLPEREDVLAVSKAFMDPFEYLVLRGRDGLLREDFKQPLGRISYHIPCHARVQNMGRKTQELLQRIPGTEVHTVERCSGHDGTWGVKEEYFEISMRIGKPVFKAMAAPQPQWIASDCAIAGRHIAQGVRELNSATAAQASDATLGLAPVKAHPLTLLRRAYGI